jgi:hypothetical protein
MAVFDRLRRRKVEQPETLTEAIVLVASCPCEAHQQAFFRLAASADEWLFAIAEASFDVVNGSTRTVAADDRVAFRTVVVDSGAHLALAFPDQAAALRNDPAAAYAGVAPAQAARLVLADPALAGILVAAQDDTNAWAALERPALEAIIAT